MKLLTLVYVFCLFYVFIPGNIFTLPVKTSRMNMVLLHALLFSVMLYTTYPYIENMKLTESYTQLPYTPNTESKQSNISRTPPPVTPPITPPVSK